MALAELQHETWTHHTASVNGVRLHYVEAGSGPLVVLLHGFPEFWYSWRKQIPALAAAGFRVIAPDLRGYNLSDKPAGVSAYQIEELTADVAGLIREAGEDRAVVAGHDWGGVVAWDLAMHRPEVVRRLVILNAPHPATYLRELRTPGQLLRSWYVFFFQVPWLPERFIRAGNFAGLERGLKRQPVHPGAFTEEDILRYKEALSQPGALTAGVNYYRAALRRNPRELFRRVRPVAADTLVIWGLRDPYLVPRLTEGLEAWVPNLRVERIPDSSHWVQNDVPGTVNRLMLEFLQPVGAGRGR